MRHWRLGFTAGPWVGALLAFLTLGIVWPSEARAGCSSHYVTSRFRLHAEDSHLELLNLAGMTTGSEQEAPPEKPTPCSGALCSGNPAVPVPTMPGLVAPPGGHWALLTVAVPPGHPDASASALADATLHPVDRCRSIFHPPRLSPHHVNS